MKPRVLSTAAVVVVLAAATVAALMRLTALPDDAALAVGDKVVTVAQLEQRAQALRAVYGVRQPSDPEGADRFRRDLARSESFRLVLDDAAAQRGTVIAEKQVRDALDAFVRRHYPEGRGAYTKALSDNGASERALLDETRSQLVTERLFDDVTRGIPRVNATDVRRAFQERRREFVRPELRRISNIVVADRAEAKALVKRLRAGADFAALAREISLDGSSREAGGDLGRLAARDLEKAYGEAAFHAARGEVFGPVRTTDGWNIGRVVEIERSAPLTLATVRDDLREQLDTERRLRAWRQWRETALAGADIRYADDYRPTDDDNADWPKVMTHPLMWGSAGVLIAAGAVYFVWRRRVRSGTGEESASETEGGRLE